MATTLYRSPPQKSASDPHRVQRFELMSFNRKPQPKNARQKLQRTSFGKPGSRTMTLTKFSSSRRVSLYSSGSSRRDSRNASRVLSSGPCDGGASMVAEDVG